MSDRPFPLSEIPSTKKRVEFLTTKVPPPTPLYIDEKDTLFVELRNFTQATAIRISSRLLRADGTISTHSEDFLPLTFSYSNASKLIPLAEGYLLSLAITEASNISFPGSTYTQASILRGGLSSASTFVSHILIQGYLTKGSPLAWPGGLHQRPGDGRGFVRSILGTAPAAGAEITETVPSSTLWRLHSFAATLTTDATVATRQPILVIDDGLNVLYRRLAELDTVASQTLNYHAAPVGFAPRALATAACWALPPALPLRAAYRIRTTTNNMQAGDQWGAPLLLVEQWHYV